MKIYLTVVSIFITATLATNSPRTGFLKSSHNDKVFQVSGGIRGVTSDDCGDDTEVINESYAMQTANEEFFKCIESKCGWDNDNDVITKDCEVSSCSIHIKETCENEGGTCYEFDYRCTYDGANVTAFNAGKCYASICTDSEKKSDLKTDTCVATQGPFV
mmetsp:Transcript_26572/g.32187  ORF Transcript_26572/g.32187 Transcript_26572/m.32187 type:complete len:160 (+) Transcript_26572:68-547(+)